jgi:predicted nucleic acid-binding protein
MKSAFIVDCSVAMTWAFADEATELTRALFRRLVTEATLVPAHWFLEVTNVLATSERRGRITVAESAQFLQTLNAISIETDSEATSRTFDNILSLSRTHSLTTYGAAYLDLALRRQLPLATLDDDLRRAATALGVQLLGK